MQSTDNEIWAPIDGYDGRYEVSNLGRVRNLEFRDTLGRRVAPRVKRPGIDSWGYAQANLRDNGEQHLVFVHRLVMEAFVGPMPEGMQVCHNNGDKSDNRLENLRYDTGSSNTFDSVAHKTHPQTRLTHCKRGHLLEQPNLLASKSNRRVCRACGRAKHRAYRLGEPFSDAFADRAYREIMG